MGKHTLPTPILVRLHQSISERIESIIEESPECSYLDSLEVDRLLMTAERICVEND